MHFNKKYIQKHSVFLFFLSNFAPNNTCISMGKELMKPDFIFESSWEVCNKVGGIYTVLSSRAKTLQDEMKDRIIFIGPDFWKENDEDSSKNVGESPYFKEDKSLFAQWQWEAKEQGLSVRIGRWTVPGEPIAVLVDFKPFFEKKNEIYGWLWEHYKVDSLHAYGDYDEASMFSYAAALVVELIFHAFRAGRESAAQLRKGFHRGAGARELVALEINDLLLDLYGNGNDLIVETAAVLGSFGLLLRGYAERIQLFTGDAPDVADVLGGGAHVVVVERIPQAVLDHSVNELLVTHAGAPAGVEGGVRSHGHVFGAAADNDVGIAGQDGAGALDHGLHAGAADHADGIGGNTERQTGLHADLTGNVLALSSSQDAAEH